MKKKPEKILPISEETSVKAGKLESLIKLSNDIRKSERRLPISFNEFLYLASTNMECVFRDIFQLFHDMVNYYVPEGIDDYNDKESIGYVKYDLQNLFVKDCDSPFFGDRLFANRFMNLVAGFRKGTQGHNIFLFEGPPGSGKSTFLNILLQKLEDYAKTNEGTTYKLYWKLDIEQLGGLPIFDVEPLFYANRDYSRQEKQKTSTMGTARHPGRYIEFSCPNHDHPILIIPKSYRRQFLDELIPDSEFKSRLFSEKQYEWVFRDVPCNICNSVYKSLLDATGDPLKVYDMVYARKNFFSRQLGEGISVFSPGDQVINEPISNPTLQNWINLLFRNDDVNFTFSHLAKTNNGLYALMDIKENNVERLKKLHGIISDGVHKVYLAEEYIKTLFLGLINPDDKKHYEYTPSFKDRIITVNVPYILDYNTEVAIYKNKFGSGIENMFLPRVLENFAKIIIASRLDSNSQSMKKWIPNPEKYKKYNDKGLLLLKMGIYTGRVPSWLTDDDLKKFDRQTRKMVIGDSDNEGRKGFSGRQSLIVFDKFLSKYGQNAKILTMDTLSNFFKNKEYGYDIPIPDGFIDSLVNLYDFNVLQEVKEAIYHYNKKRISRDIQNYLFAVNYETGETKKCDYTGDTIIITEDYLKDFEAIFLGTTGRAEERKIFRESVRSEYVRKTLYKEIRLENKAITDTAQFNAMFEKYKGNLRENALAPFSNNENFRRAIQDFGSVSFRTYDNRLRRDVSRLLGQLQKKFNYTEDGARQVSIYVLDKDLAKKY